MYRTRHARQHTAAVHVATVRVSHRDGVTAVHSGVCCVEAQLDRVTFPNPILGHGESPASTGQRKALCTKTLHRLTAVSVKVEDMKCL